MSQNATIVVGSGEIVSDLRYVSHLSTPDDFIYFASERQLRQHHLLQSAHWNFDVLGDTALTYASGSGLRELPYRPGPGLFYINQPTHDGQRRVLANV